MDVVIELVRVSEGVRAKKRAGSPTLSLQLKLERFRWDDER